jgi:Nif-specific regulatory protein
MRHEPPVVALASLLLTHIMATSTKSAKAATEWRAHELLLMSEVMRLVGKSLAPDVVLREMLHLMSELLGLNRGRIVLADFVGDIAHDGLADRKPERVSDH